MGTCMARSGFLTLSDCGEPAASMCATCARPICAAHLAPQSGFTKCLDCAATDPNVEEGEGEYDDVWAHRYRNDYYSGTYTPFYVGTTHDTYYDRQDVRSFDSSANEFTEEDEGEGGSFIES